MNHPPSFHARSTRRATPRFTLYDTLYTYLSTRPEGRSAALYAIGASTVIGEWRQVGTVVSPRVIPVGPIRLDRVTGTVYGVVGVVTDPQTFTLSAGNIPDGVYPVRVFDVSAGTTSDDVATVSGGGTACTLAVGVPAIAAGDYLWRTGVTEFTMGGEGDVTKRNFSLEANSALGIFDSGLHLHNAYVTGRLMTYQAARTELGFSVDCDLIANWGADTADQDILVGALEGIAGVVMCGGMRTHSVGPVVRRCAASKSKTASSNVATVGGTLVRDSGAWRTRCQCFSGYLIGLSPPTTAAAAHAYQVHANEPVGVGGLFFRARPGGAETVAATFTQVEISLP